MQPEGGFVQRVQLHKGMEVLEHLIQRVFLVLTESDSIQEPPQFDWTPPSAWMLIGAFEMLGNRNSLVALVDTVLTRISSVDERLKRDAWGVLR